MNIKHSILILCSFALLMVASPTDAQNVVTFKVATNAHKLKPKLQKNSSLLTAQKKKGRTTSDLFAAALSDYRQLTQTLYANGYYGGVVSVKIDGQEAALIPPFDVPKTIKKITVSVTPGQPFKFSTAKVAPLAKDSEIPTGFRRGKIAKSTYIQSASDAAVQAWRNAGHAKATLAAQNITANHDTARLAATLTLRPGPKVRFATLHQTTQNAVRPDRIARIAGLPTGEVYAPATLDKVAKRLRRTGAFSSVTLTESDTLNADNTLDIGLALVDQKPKRFGLGIELSSFQGVELSTFWMHRNAFGGGERFRLDGVVSGIGGQNGGVDYELGARIDQPATFGPDTDGFVFTRLSFDDELSYTSRTLNLGFGITRLLTDNIASEVGVAWRYSQTTDSSGAQEFTLFTLPSSLTWDRRNDRLDAEAGTYLKANATPFVSLETGGTGLWLQGDARAYHPFGTGNRLVLAGRVQFGSVLSQSTNDIPPDYLFYSRGCGSVRGQPYQSLGQTTATGAFTGGQSFVSFSTELRAKVSKSIGLVGFVDVGTVASDSHLSDKANWHSGGGVGLRYQTPIGPLRLDVAVPISGDTGNGVQVYIGIGQAF